MGRFAISSPNQGSGLEEPEFALEVVVESSPPLRRGGGSKSQRGTEAQQVQIAE